MLNHVKTNCNHKSEKGFTLVELVVVLALTGILVAAISPFIYTNVDAFIRMRGGKSVVQGARIGLNRMTEELKRAVNIDYGYSDRIRFDFEEPDGTFRSNILYRYYSDESALTREDEALVPLVQNFVINYYDVNDNLINPGWSTNPIRRIEIQISVGSPELYTVIETQVAPRILLIQSRS